MSQEQHQAAKPEASSTYPSEIHILVRRKMLEFAATTQRGLERIFVENTKHSLTDTEDKVMHLKPSLVDSKFIHVCSEPLKNTGAFCWLPHDSPFCRSSSCPSAPEPRGKHVMPWAKALHASKSSPVKAGLTCFRQQCRS